MEIANAFCEINDPNDQQNRFEAKCYTGSCGDEEAMVIDETTFARCPTECRRRQAKGLVSIAW